MQLVYYNVAYISLEVSDRRNNKFTGLILSSKYKALLNNTYLIPTLIFKMIGLISEINYK